MSDYSFIAENSDPTAYRYSVDEGKYTTDDEPNEAVTEAVFDEDFYSEINTPDLTKLDELSCSEEQADLKISMDFGKASAETVEQVSQQCENELLLDFEYCPDPDQWDSD